MQKNEYSKVTLSAEAQACLLQLHNTLLAKQYSVRTIRNYVQEMRFLFAHYYDVLPQSISQPDIINYITFIIKEHGVVSHCPRTVQPPLSLTGINIKKKYNKNEWRKTYRTTTLPPAILGG